MDEEKLARLYALEEELGLRFELTDSGLTLKAMPGVEHQRSIYQIQRSMDTVQAYGRPCGCQYVADVDLVFPDGTVKRPDVSVSCKRPGQLEGFVHGVPEAVSPKYEGKDIVCGPPKVCVAGRRT